jgi:ATP-dependent DNA ligase
MGLQGIVSKGKDSPYRSGRSPDWLKMKNPACAAVKREALTDRGRYRRPGGMGGRAILGGLFIR